MRRTASAIAKPIIFDDALITSVLPYGESDCVVRMLTRTHGRVAAFFRRGRASKKGSNNPQAPALATVGFVAGDQKLLRLTSLELLPTTLHVNCLRAFGYGVYIAELIEKLIPEEDHAEEIFAIVEEAFIALAEEKADARFLRAFELKLLDHCGYLPELPSSCEEEKIVAFDPMTCRFLEEVCEHSFAFSMDGIRLARDMLIAKIGRVNYGRDDELIMIGRIFQSRLKLLGIYPLKSVAFLKQLSER